jgi:hypothetical protein
MLQIYYNICNNYIVVTQNNIKIKMYMEVIQSFKERWFKNNV